MTCVNFKQQFPTPNQSLMRAAEHKQIAME